MNDRSFFLALMGSLTLAACPAWADNPALPGEGFAASRYEALWTKSPFAVASSDAAAPDSADYSLVGIAQIDGIYYANLIDKQTQEHFLVTSDKPTRGVTLLSVTRGQSAADIQAIVQKNGQSITLKMDLASLATPMAANGVSAITMPGAASNIPMPGASSPQSLMPGGFNRANFYSNNGQMPPRVMMRPRLIHVPPYNPQQQPAPTQPPGQNNQPPGQNLQQQSAK